MKSTWVLDCMSKNVASRLREITLYSTCEIISGVLSPVLGFSVQKKPWETEVNQQRTTDVTRGLKNVMCEKSLRNLGLVSMEKGSMIVILNCQIHG